MTIPSNAAENRTGTCPVCGPTDTATSAGGAMTGSCTRCGYRVWFTHDTSEGAQTIRPTIKLVPADVLDKLIGTMTLPAGKTLVIDFSDVDLLPSACLGKLVRLSKNVEAVGGKLVLQSLSPNLLNVFQITGLDRVLTIQS